MRTPRGAVLGLIERACGVDLRDGQSGCGWIGGSTQGVDDPGGVPFRMYGTQQGDSSGDEWC